MFDALKVKNECVEWIKKFFEENGKDCCAVLGISGGKDSSVAAALCVEALGKDRVVGVLMPQGVQHDIDMAYMLVNHLDVASLQKKEVLTLIVEGNLLSFFDLMRIYHNIAFLCLTENFLQHHHRKYSAVYHIL